MDGLIQYKNQLDQLVKKRSMTEPETAHKNGNRPRSAVVSGTEQMTRQALLAQQGTDPHP